MKKNKDEVEFKKDCSIWTGKSDPAIKADVIAEEKSKLKKEGGWGKLTPKERKETMNKIMKDVEETARIAEIMESLSSMSCHLKEEFLKRPKLKRLYEKNKDSWKHICKLSFKEKLRFLIKGL